MHKIKEMLMNELYEYEEKAKKNPNGKVSPQELEKIHMLTDTIKNIGKIEMLDEGGYSEDGHYMGEGRIYGTSYEDGVSYRRGRGRNARRDSMGRYSSDDDMSYEGGSYARGGQGGNRGGQGGRGGYSRDGAKNHLIKKAEEMLEMAQDSEDKKAIRQFIARLENDD